jgi:hypothetical protein
MHINDYQKLGEWSACTFLSPRRSERVFIHCDDLSSLMHDIIFKIKVVTFITVLTDTFF